MADAPWHFTTWLDLLDHWQSLAAGLLAFVAALIVVVGSEWRERKALRASLGSEIRLYVGLLIAMRERLARLKPDFIDGTSRQRDLRDLVLLHPPTVYPAAAASKMGLLRKPRAAGVVAFYATIEQLNFTVRTITNDPAEKVSDENYEVVAALFEEACRGIVPLLSELLFDKRDAEFREEITKWDADHPSER